VNTRDIVITVLIGLFFFVLFMVFIFQGCEESSKSRLYYEKKVDAYCSNYKIKLKGKIKNKTYYDSRKSLYTIKIDSGNVWEHDVRKDKEDYYLIIRGDSALMIDGNYFANVNDAVCIDYSKRLKIFWNNYSYRKEELDVLTPYYKKLY